MHKDTHPQLARAFRQHKRYGIPYDAWLAYQAQFHNCRRRGLELRFSLRAWWAWWSVIGWEKRGRRKGQLMMLRIDDQGHYEPGNVYAGSASDNGRDAWCHPTAAMTAASELLGKIGSPHLSDRQGHPRSRPVTCPLGQFPSAALAADAAGISHSYAQRLARHNKRGWSYA